MDQTDDQLDALGRITRAIKRFRQQSPVSQMNTEQTKGDYLKTHLSAEDWLFWEELQTQPSESKLAYQQFYHLLSQYRRAGFESWPLWCQTQAAASDP